MRRAGRSRLSTGDRLRLSTLGLTSRPGRTALSALGIAIGITALVGVLGLAESSRADLNAQLEALGTNLLTAQPGQDFMGEDADLPDGSVGMVDRMDTVATAAATRSVPVSVRRNEWIPDEQTSGIAVGAADLALLDAVAGSLRSGRWLDAASADVPTVVLGATAARRLGITDAMVARGVRVLVDDEWFSVVGVLDPVLLAPELDEHALVGLGVAAAVWGDDLPPTRIYARAVDGRVAEARELLPRTVDPGNPTEVEVSRPSDALAAQAAADESLTTLTLGLGAVALLVGAVGIANTMVISVLERRREIGVRRALGATRAAIGGQFLGEAVLLSLLGGLTGALLGVLGTIGYASHQDWGIVVPWTPIGFGLLAACVIGTVVGLYPAVRASRVPPTEALRAV